MRWLHRLVEERTAVYMTVHINVHDHCIRYFPDSFSLSFSPVLRWVCVEREEFWMRRMTFECLCFIPIWLQSCYFWRAGNVSSHIPTWTHTHCSIRKFQRVLLKDNTNCFRLLFLGRIPVHQPQKSQRITFSKERLRVTFTFSISI